jgi:membrane associated rhomboid family serine protease
MKPFKPPPAPVTRWIIALCVLVEVATTLLGNAVAVTESAGLIPARLVDGIGGGLPAPLTLVTALFLHAGWVHLLLNLVFLGWVGKYVEWVFGRWRFIGLYLAGGVAGNLLQVAVDPHSTGVVLGASGAIAAVFGAYAVLFARSRASARKVFGVSVSSEAATALWFACTWIGLQLVTAYVFRLEGQGIAAWAHIGGFITGLVLVQPLTKEPRI